MQNIQNLQNLQGLSKSRGLTQFQQLYNYIKSLDGLVAYYPLNELSGSTAFNQAPETKGTLDGATTGATVAQPGKVGRAYSFDGTGDFVNVSDNDSLDFGTGDFSVLLLVKLTDDGLLQYVLSKNAGAGNANNTGGQGWEILYRAEQAGNELQFRVNDGVAGGSGTALQITTVNVGDGNWHFIAFVIDRDGTSTAYADGISVDTGDLTAQGGSVSSTGNLYLMSNNVGAANFSVGLLQHFAAFNRALSAAEILKLAKISGLA